MLFRRGKVIEHFFYWWYWVQTNSSQEHTNVYISINWIHYNAYIPNSSFTETHKTRHTLRILLGSDGTCSGITPELQFAGIVCHQSANFLVKFKAPETNSNDVISSYMIYKKCVLQPVQPMTTKCEVRSSGSRTVKAFEC